MIVFRTVLKTNVIFVGVSSGCSPLTRCIMLWNKDPSMEK